MRKEKKSLKWVLMVTVTVLMSCCCYNKLLQSERFENNMSVLSYSCGGQKSEMGLRLKSRRWQGWFLLEALGKNLLLCLFQLLEVFRCREISFQWWIIMSRDEGTQIYLFSTPLHPTAIEFQVKPVYEERALIWKPNSCPPSAFHMWDDGGPKD